jgi:hypothetical protein
VEVIERLGEVDKFLEVALELCVGLVETGVAPCHHGMCSRSLHLSCGVGAEEVRSLEMVIYPFLVEVVH